VYLKDLENPSSQSHAGEQVDYETEHWPVAAHWRAELNALKYEHSAKPLRIYVKDRFVEPADVNDSIRGALIEVHSELWHFFIAPDSYDTFNATVEQILVLQSGVSRPETPPYERKKCSCR